MATASPVNTPTSPFGSSSERGSTIRRRKNNLSEPVRILVLGCFDVGKSALVVRCITKKFIGEYSLLDDAKYRYIELVENEDILVDILDSCCKSAGERFTSTENMKWADAFVLVYSISDRESFDYIDALKHRINEFRKGTVPPIVLVANKADLEHRRQVSTEEGKNYAGENHYMFIELSAAEQPRKVRDFFVDISKEVALTKRKSKNFLDRVFAGIVPTKSKQ